MEIKKEIMLLKNKNAIIYGAGGAVGAAIAEAFAREGAKVFLTGRTLSKVEIVAKKIADAGGTAEIATVDALYKRSVEIHLDDVMIKEGHIDISFNAISINDIQGAHLTEMSYEDFISPVINAMASYFITATAAIRQMKKNNTGVILAITANAGYKPYEYCGGFGIACAAIEGFCRQIAEENGRYGIRVICLRSAGSPDSPSVDEALNIHAKSEGVSREEFERKFAETTMLKRLPLLQEIANAAVIMASDKASAATAAVINLTCGEIAD